MHFVDRHGRSQRLARFALRHPSIVIPGIVQIPDDRCRLRRNLVEDGKRIRFLHPMAHGAGMDEIFVERAFVDTGNKTFPDPRISARMKPIALLVPMVKSAGHENLLGIGRPDGEIGSLDSFADEPVRTKFFVRARITPLVEQIQLFVGEDATAARPTGLPAGRWRYCHRDCLAIFWSSRHAHNSAEYQ